MYNDLIEYIKIYLEKYEEIIEKLDENFDEIEIFGKYQARAPLSYKYEISFLIEYLQNKSLDLSTLIKEYDKINTNLRNFEQKKGISYWDKVYEELIYLVEDYSTTACLFLELDPIEIETDDDLNKRDLIEILLVELEKRYEVNDIKVEIQALDKVLKCKFKMNIDILMKECPDIQKVYFPENFWWRHPSKFINGKSSGNIQ